MKKATNKVTSEIIGSQSCRNFKDPPASSSEHAHLYKRWNSCITFHGKKKSCR